MKNNDIYEHIAKVYLDPSAHKKKNLTSSKPRFKNFLKFSIIALATSLIIIIATIFLQQNEFSQSQSKESISTISPQISKINFHDFELGRKKIITLDLNTKNLLGYKTLGFSARKSNYQDKLLMRIELVDELGKQSEVCIDQLPTYKWKDFTINLAEFKGNSNRSRVALLTFIVEEWNTHEGNRALLYIDNVHFLK